MSVDQDVFSFIDALPDAVLIIDRRRGKVAGANAKFFKLTGFVEDVFLDTQIFKLPFSNKGIKRGLFRLFVKALRGEAEGKEYSFPHVHGDGTIINLLASAGQASLGGIDYVVFTLKENQSREILFAGSDDGDSWKSYLSLAYEPYMEFRPERRLPPLEDQDDRLEYLHTLGESLKVKFSNSAAVKFYHGDKGSLVGDTFLSLFNKESDALGFLDMLYAVGQMKAETTVNTYKEFAVQIEMHCVVNFDDEGSIAVLYCSQKDLSSQQRYKAIIGGSRIEMDFIFNQPFVGLAFLFPTQSLERPKLENLDATLDEMLNHITVVRANQAMMNIYGTDRSKFLMKPMRELFCDNDVARQVLKELFVMRASSSAREALSGDAKNAERVALFQAIFDDADRLTGVLVVVSRHDYGYKARHTIEV